jgi:hypothetical protein
MTTSCRILLTSLERKDGTPAARRHPVRAWTQRTATPNKWYCYRRAAPDRLPGIAQTSSRSPRRGPRALGAIVWPESATGFRCYARLHQAHGPTEHHFLVCGICARNRRRGAQKMHVPSTRAQRARTTARVRQGPKFEPRSFVTTLVRAARLHVMLAGHNCGARRAYGQAQLALPLSRREPPGMWRAHDLGSRRPGRPVGALGRGGSRHTWRAPHGERHGHRAASGIPMQPGC